MTKTTSATFIKNITMAKKDFKKQQTAFKKAFIESIQSLIKSDKSVDYISWEQYTPSYNDGDAPQFYCRATSGYFNISYDGTLINYEDDNFERFSSKQIAKYRGNSIIDIVKHIAYFIICSACIKNYFLIKIQE